MLKQQQKVYEEIKTLHAAEFKHEMRSLGARYVLLCPSEELLTPPGAFGAGDSSRCVLSPSGAQETLEPGEL